MELKVAVLATSVSETANRGHISHIEGPASLISARQIVSGIVELVIIAGIGASSEDAGLISTF